MSSVFSLWPVSSSFEPWSQVLNPEVKLDWLQSQVGLRRAVNCGSRVVWFSNVFRGFIVLFSKFILSFYFCCISNGIVIHFMREQTKIVVFHFVLLQVELFAMFFKYLDIFLFHDVCTDARQFLSECIFFAFLWFSVVFFCWRCACRLWQKVRNALSNATP